MILAAGRGERMRPLTDSLPKPLLEVGGKPLIVRHIERLSNAGFHDIVINVAHLGHMIMERLGDGKHYGVNISYSQEEAALETAGGIANALDLLGSAPFVVVNSDVYCDYDCSALIQRSSEMPGILAHLVLVDNPAHHPEGDFFFENGRLLTAGHEKLTYSGIGLYHPDLFFGIERGKPAKLAPLLRHAISEGRVTGSLHRGTWIDVGTPERLSELNGRIEA